MLPSDFPRGPAGKRFRVVIVDYNHGVAANNDGHVLCEYCTKEEAHMIAAALEQVANLEDGGWRPIETAPKDFTPILLVWKWDSGLHTGTSVVLAQWTCRRHSHLSRRGNCPNEPDCDMGWDHYAGEFTHWMPLPHLPAETNEEPGVVDGKRGAE